MNHWCFSQFLTADGWQSDCYVDCDSTGQINKISNTPTAGVANYQRIEGYSLPTFCNVHSHAFQYAIAGLGEFFSADSEKDDFWSWRQSMYKLALAVSPEAVETIATALYLNMLKAGYSHVAEFHYLHKAPDGNAYENTSQISLSLCNAAKKVGMNLTLVPVFYRSSSFGTPSLATQRRFVFKDTKEYFKLIDELRILIEPMNHVNLGLGVHSLRAASIEEVVEISEYRRSDEVFHIHVSEQLKEVEDCQTYYGKRPVELLLDSCSSMKGFFLVHATHLNETEVSCLASSEATVVLCPTTEANLGDGVFPLNDFCKTGGDFCIGSDSHISIDPFEEIKWLDYGQRLYSGRRQSVVGVDDSAAYLMKQCWRNGQKALGLNGSSIFPEVGSPLNVLTVSDSYPLLSQRNPQTWLATMLYAIGKPQMESVMINGQRVIKESTHSCEASVNSEFSALMTDLKL